jgi:hypothetical protein
MPVLVIGAVFAEAIAGAEALAAFAAAGEVAGGIGAATGGAGLIDLGTTLEGIATGGAEAYAGAEGVMSSAGLVDGATALNSSPLADANLMTEQEGFDSLKQNVVDSQYQQQPADVAESPMSPPATQIKPLENIPSMAQDDGTTPAINDQINAMKPNAVPSITDMLKTVGKTLNENKLGTAVGLNFLGGLFDKQKAAQTELLKTQTENLNNQMQNAKAVPDITNLQVNPSANLYGNTTPPTFYAPRVGLINRTGR